MDLLSDDYDSDEDYSWISWFVCLKGNEFFCEVDESYAEDAFNLTGLAPSFPYFKLALEMILDIEMDSSLDDDTIEAIEANAELLYGMIHARFIVTTRGLHLMMEKFKTGKFGRCPRALCYMQPVVPVGLYDAMDKESVKLYCPRCDDVYTPKSGRHEHIDGAFFGTTFAHLFFLTFPELKNTSEKTLYIPRVFGFKLNKDAHSKSLIMRKKHQQDEKDRKAGQSNALKPNRL